MSDGSSAISQISNGPYGTPKRPIRQHFPGGDAVTSGPVGLMSRKGEVIDRREDAEEENEGEEEDKE